MSYGGTRVMMKVKHKDVVGDIRRYDYVARGGIER